MKIDKEFHDLIPPLTPNEFDLLEKSILKEGLREPLVVWESSLDGYCKECYKKVKVVRGDGIWKCEKCGYGIYPITGKEILLDGHNRYKIAQKHKLKYNIIHIELLDRNEAMSWIIKNQFGRRNLTPFQRSELALKLKPLLAEKAKEKEKTHTKQGYQKSGDPVRTDKDLAKIAGVSHDTIAKVEKIKQKAPKEVQEKVRSGDVSVNKAYHRIKLDEIKASQQKNKPIPPPKNKYSTIVIDPPWPITKVTREVRPKQDVGLDYPTMSIEQITSFPISKIAADNCHVYLWTTQKYLPIAFNIFNAWDVKYIFTMVWHKPGGFQPFGLPQYNAEFVLFGKRGTLSFLDTKAFPCCFNAGRGKHSEKPDEFYDIVSRVSPNPKIDIFARKKRKGYSVYGNEL